MVTVMTPAIRILLLLLDVLTVSTMKNTKLPDTNIIIIIISSS